MPDDPTPPGHRRRRPSRGSSGTGDGSKKPFDWRHPKSWTRNQRWGGVFGGVAVVLVVLLVVLLASGSSKKPVVKTSSPTTPPTASTISHKQRPKPGPPVCPLTGTPAPGGKVPMRPALAFKVDNYPTGKTLVRNRQGGHHFRRARRRIHHAAVAVFQCQEASLVGPIRSARYVDQGIGDLLSRPILIHVGSINQVTTCPRCFEPHQHRPSLPAVREHRQNPPGREAPYDTYASTRRLGSRPKDKTPPAAVFQYSATVPKGSPDSSLAINFSSTSDETWTYDSANHTYALSYSDTGPAMVQQPMVS